LRIPEPGGRGFYINPSRRGWRETPPGEGLVQDPLEAPPEPSGTPDPRGPPAGTAGSGRSPTPRSVESLQASPGLEAG